MLKIAYQSGVRKALCEEDLEVLVKEAQELGLDWEKLAVPGLGAVGKGLSALGGGMKAMGSTVRPALAGGKMYANAGMLKSPLMQQSIPTLQRGLHGFSKIMGNKWKSLDPLQKKMMLGTGVAGLYTA